MASESRDDHVGARNSTNRSNRNQKNKFNRKNSFKRKFHVPSRTVILEGGDYGDFEDKFMHIPKNDSNNSSSHAYHDTSSISDVSCYERKQDWKRVEQHNRHNKKHSSCKSSIRSNKEKTKSGKNKGRNSSSSARNNKTKSAECNNSDNRDSFLEEADDEMVSTMGLCKLCGGTEDILTSSESFEVSSSTLKDYESYQNEKLVFIVEVLGTTSTRKSISRRERRCLLRTSMHQSTIVNDHGSSSNSKSRSVYYNLGINFAEIDGLAIVESVMYPSSAHYSGVNESDVVNFAVPLNMSDEKLDLDLAKQIASRLEKTGRRTSYRDLFDMFTSKTTAGWPIAIVFESSESSASGSGDASFKRSTIPSDCNLASRFLSSLSFNARDTAFYHWDDDNDDIVLSSSNITNNKKGNIEDFMIQPKSYRKKDLLLDMDDSLFFCASAMGCNNNISTMIADFQNAKKLRNVIKGAQAIVYLSCTISSMGILQIINGNGIFVARLKQHDGSGSSSWSSPSTIAMNSVNMKVGSITYKEEVNCTCFIYSDFILQKLIKEGTYKFKNHERLMTIISYDKNKECYNRLNLNNDDITFDTIKNNMNNTYLYGSKVRTCDIVSGDVKDYYDFKQLHGAIKSLEDPYTMYAHPVTPNSIKSYYIHDWNIENSCIHDDYRSGGNGLDLRSFYADLNQLVESSITGKQRSSSSSNRRFKASEELSEINIYLQKFIRFLIDGVPVRYLKTTTATVGDDNDQQAQPEDENNNKVPCVEIYQLNLIYEIEDNNFDDPIMKLVFINKDNNESSPSLRKPSLSITTPSSLIEEQQTNNNSIQIDTITRVSRSAPSSCNLEINKKRLLCIHDDDNDVHHVFFTRNDADHVLLMCGLKILLEKVVRRRSYF